MPKANHFVPPLLVLFLGCTALASGAQAGWFDGGEKPKPATVQPEAKEKAPPSPAANLDESIRQAQLLRLAGSYPEAIKHLSQLMIVAADDPRVVSEYGKTLAQMGRASDAVNFLTRAEQLSPTDWTIYSALGVAYDQVGNQKQAQGAYEHALALNPGDPSVLNNYALSRMLAKDTAMAQSLAARAEAANAAIKDDKIVRNIAMIRAMAPDVAPAVAANKPAPAKAQADLAAGKPAAAPASQSMTPVAQQALPHAPQPVNQQALPQPPAPKITQAPLPAPDHRVVMQRVPTDPLAGPVASHPPRPLQPTAKAEVAASKTEPKLEAAAKPAAKPETKTAEAKPAAKVESASTAKSGPVAKLDIAPPKADGDKAATKPATAKAETKPDKKAIPGLRLSANAF